MTAGVWLPDEISSPQTETKWKWSLIDGLVIPVELVTSDITGGIISSYFTSENQLNQPIDEELFDSNGFRAKEGDYLVDDISSKILRFNGSAFVDPGEEPSKSSW